VPVVRMGRARSMSIELCIANIKSDVLGYNAGNP